MDNEKFLERYDGQSTDELIALAGSYRVDSLVLAFEEAIQQKASKQPISTEETHVLAVEALEREVNNGGYSQFFLNASNLFAGTIVEALRAIGCPATALITEDAIKALGIKGKLTPEALEAIVSGDNEQVEEMLSACDDRYYANTESIEDRLFEWIKENRSRIEVRNG
jgi:hypothetical protein